MVSKQKMVFNPDAGFPDSMPDSEHDSFIERIADWWVCLWSPHYKATLAYKRRLVHEQAHRDTVLRICKDYYREGK